MTKDEPRRGLIIPALASILGWAESLNGAALHPDEVAFLVGKAPAMVLPVSLANLVDRSRPQPDLDPESAWEQWQYLRGEMVREGIPSSRAFPAPQVQLDIDLRLLAQVLNSTGKYDAALLTRQLEVLSDHATKVLAWLEHEIRVRR